MPLSVANLACFCVMFEVLVGLTIGFAIRKAESLDGDGAIGFSVGWSWWKMLMTLQGVASLKQAARCFFALGSFFMKLYNGGLVANLLVCCHRPRYCKVSWLCTFYCCHLLVLIERFYLPIPLLWCSTPAVIREKHCGFSTSLVVLICGLIFLLDVELQKDQKI